MNQQDDESFACCHYFYASRKGHGLEEAEMMWTQVPSSVRGWIR